MFFSSWRVSLKKKQKLCQPVWLFILRCCSCPHLDITASKKINSVFLKWNILYFYSSDFFRTASWPLRVFCLDQLGVNPSFFCSLKHFSFKPVLFDSTSRDEAICVSCTPKGRDWIDQLRDYFSDQYFFRTQLNVYLEWHVALVS